MMKNNIMEYIPRGDCLTVGQLKKILQDLPDDLDIIAGTDEFDCGREIVRIVTASNIVCFMISEEE